MLSKDGNCILLGDFNGMLEAQKMGMKEFMMGKDGKSKMKMEKDSLSLHIALIWWLAT